MPGVWRPINKPEELQRGDVLCVFKGDVGQYVGQHMAIVTTTSNIPVANVVLVGVADTVVGPSPIAGKPRDAKRKMDIDIKKYVIRGEFLYYVSDQEQGTTKEYKWVAGRAQPFNGQKVWPKIYQTAVARIAEQTSSEYAHAWCMVCSSPFRDAQCSTDPTHKRHRYYKNPTPGEWGYDCCGFVYHVIMTACEADTTPRTWPAWSEIKDTMQIGPGCAPGVLTFRDFFMGQGPQGRGQIDAAP